MTVKTFSRMALACVAAIAATSAFAVPEFTVTPTAIPGVSSFFQPYTATAFSGTSTELLHYTPSAGPNTQTGGTITGTGYVSLTGAVNDNTSTNLLSTQTGLNFGSVGGITGYGLYLTFSLTATVTSGDFGKANSVNAINSLDFKVYADPGATNTYTPANATTGTEAAVVQHGGLADVLLAEGTFLTGTAGIDNLGGAFLNSIQSFAICTGVGQSKVGNTTIPNADCTSAAGQGFFSAPVPFYTMAFDAFNNTTQGVTLNGNTASVVSATGVVDFNGGNRVPEPATLALVGAALAGLGLARRNRKA